MLQIYEAILMPWVILGCITFLVLLKIPAPYGKFTKTSWGPMIPSQLGWFVMEIISPAMFAYFFLIGDTDKNWVMWMFFICWVGHYTNRSIIYPLRQKNPAKMPLSIALFAFLFNIVNGFVNGYFLGSIQSYTMDYLSNWNFILGVILFLIGIMSRFNIIYFKMIEQIYNYFTIEMLYYWVNLGVLPFWLILIFFLGENRF